MKALIPAALSVLVIAGCALPARTSGELMQLPPEKVVEVNFTVSVPVSVAYSNILAKARKCWRGAHRVVVIEATPLDTTSGFARIAVETPGEILIPRMVLTVIEIFPHGENTVHLTGRSLRSKIRRFDPEADLPNLQQWAEGKEVACS